MAIKGGKNTVGAVEALRDWPTCRKGPNTTFGRSGGRLNELGRTERKRFAVKPPKIYKGKHGTTLGYALKRSKREKTKKRLFRRVLGDSRLYKESLSKKNVFGRDQEREGPQQSKRRKQDDGKKEKRT